MNEDPQIAVTPHSDKTFLAMIMFWELMRSEKNRECISEFFECGVCVWPCVKTGVKIVRNFARINADRIKNRRKGYVADV